MIIGAFYLTEAVPGAAGEGRAFRDVIDAERAYDDGQITLHSLIKVPNRDADARRRGPLARRPPTAGSSSRSACPTASSHVDQRRSARATWARSSTSSPTTTPKADVGNSLDAIKDLCFQFAAKSGLTVSIDDVKTPPEKKAILAEHEKQAEKQEEQLPQGHHHRR